MAPKAEKKPAEKKPGEEKEKKGPAKGGEKAEAEKQMPAAKEGGDDKEAETSTKAYKTYLFELLKQVHPNIGISSQAIAIMKPFINDIFEKLTIEVAKLTNENPNMTSSEIQASIRRIFLDELAKHGGSQGTKVVSKSTSN